MIDHWIIGSLYLVLVLFQSSSMTAGSWVRTTRPRLGPDSSLLARNLEGPEEPGKLSDLRFRPIEPEEGRVSTPGEDSSGSILRDHVPSAFIWIALAISSRFVRASSA